MTNNINRIVKDMEAKGEVRRRIGGINIIRYNPTPLESLLVFNPANKIKVKPNRLSNKQRAKILADWKQIEDCYGPRLDACKNYLNLSQGE
jgi:hypothetical protein